MRKIRKGKDFVVMWPIFRRNANGEREPYSIDQLTAQLRVQPPIGEAFKADEVSIEDNMVTWIFRGKSQIYSGIYNLILVENDGADGMVTVDTCKAFNLVEHSCEETPDVGGDVVTDAVMLEGEVAFAPVVLKVGADYDDTELREAIADLQEKDKATDTQLAALQQKDAQTEAKLTELSEENERLRERIEEQDQFIEDLQNTKIDRENDDYYPKMAVGLADNLAGVGVVDSEINFRRSGGGAITDGVARIETIKGNSVVWNQFMDYGRAISNNKTVAAELVNGKISGYVKEAKPANNITFATVAPSGFYYRSIIGHKYMWVFSSNNGSSRVSVGDKYDLKSGVVIEAASNGYCYFYPFGSYSTIIEANTSAEFSAALYDLTQMFGSGNEPTTIEEFYQRIPMGVDLNAYNEGEVIHMDVQSIESVGVNQWDEEWELGRVNPDTGTLIVSTKDIRSKNFISVIPGKDYYFIGNSQYYVVYYDKDYQHVDWWSISSYRVLTIPNNVHYVKLSRLEVTTYNHDICVNLSDSSVNGQYFPYIKRVEDLAVIRKYFPDGMKSAGSAHDEIRYNKASGKWEKVEAIGVRAYEEGDAGNASYLTNGKVTCYPLAEPIVTELDEADQFKDLDYQVWNCGTEKAIAEGKSAPLAADITYGFNAIGKIKELESLVAALRAKVGI